ncbi:MAG: NifB/NifX family molybdenum-iron cluster-binding protein [Candidatus Latescibacterota bacterium]|nr:MAG: NifB/NifX family molybdenum-iron cluster-binding protein [Candidatus Latescibacterota bacterium]
MRVAIASDDGKTIAPHFGKARGFIIYDVEDGKVQSEKFVENTFTGHARGLSGADHAVDRHGPILQALKDCNAVISHGMGRRIYADLRAVGIEAFVVNETDASEALSLYLRNALTDHPERGCER